MIYVKGLAIVVNLGASAFLTYELVELVTDPPDELGYLVGVFCIVAYCVLNLIFSCAVRVEGASWLGMYVKRKRLEEQKRIEALEKGD